MTPSELTFLRPAGGRLRIGADALRILERYRQLDACVSEAGGVLLGRLIVERPDTVVDTVTEPSPADRRTRFAFHRAARPTQRAVIDAWERSDGTRNFLGEWHTHPEDVPHPSEVDLRGWQRLARIARFEQDWLFFVIVGRIVTSAWEVPRGGGSVVQLTAEPPVTKLSI
jgi:integrative and conjugative element protein (TIGR02256 family)